MANTKGQARGENGDKITSAEKGNGEGVSSLKEGKRSVTELSRLFNQRREGVALVPKTSQETKRSSAVVDWMTKGNAASPAKKPAIPATPRPAIPADPLLVIARLEKAEAELEVTKTDLISLKQKESDMRKEAESAMADKLNAEIQRGAAVAQLEVVKRETDAKVRSLQDLLSNTEIKEKQAVSNAEALKAAHVEALSSVQKSQQTANQDSTAYKAMADKLSLLESQHEHAKKESAQVELVLKQTREMLKDAQAEVAQTTSILADKTVEISKLKGGVQEGKDRVASAKKAQDSAERDAEDLKVSLVQANAAKDESIALVEVSKAETSTARHEADMVKRMVEESGRRLRAAHDEVDEANVNMNRLMTKMKMEAATGAAVSAAAGIVIGAEGDRLKAEVAEAKAAALTAESRHQALRKQNQVAVTSESMAKAQAGEAKAALAKAGVSIVQLQKEVEVLQGQVEAGRKSIKEAETVVELKGAAAAAQVKAAQAAEQESGDRVRAAVEAEAAAKGVMERMRKTEQELRVQVQVAKEGAEKVRVESEESEGRLVVARAEIESMTLREKDAKAREVVVHTDGALQKAQEGEERASRVATSLQAEVLAARSKEQAARSEAMSFKEGEQRAMAEVERMRVAAESMEVHLVRLRREVSEATGAAATAERRYQAAQLELQAALSAEKRAVAGEEGAVAALAAVEGHMKGREEEVRQRGVGEVEVAHRKVAAAQAQIEAVKEEGQEWKKRMEAAIKAASVAEEAVCVVKAELRAREEREGEGKKGVERVRGEKESAMREAEGARAALATAESRYQAVVMELQAGKGSEGAVKGSVDGLAEKKVAAAQAAERESEVKLQAALSQVASSKAAQQAATASSLSLQTALDAMRGEYGALEKEVGELRGEVETARSDSSSVEKKLVAAVAALQASEAGEEATLKSMNLRATSNPSGDRSEVEALRRHVREVEGLAEMRVAAAGAEVEAAKMGEREERRKAEAAIAQLAAAREASQASGGEGGSGGGGGGSEKQAVGAAKLVSDLEAARTEAKAAKRQAEDLEWKLNALSGTKEVLEGELSKWREEAVVRRRSAAALSAQQAERDEAERQRQLRRVREEAATEQEGTIQGTAEIEEQEASKAMPDSRANGGGGLLPPNPPKEAGGGGIRVVELPSVADALPASKERSATKDNATREVGEKEKSPTCGCVIQ